MAKANKKTTVPVKRKYVKKAVVLALTPSSSAIISQGETKMTAREEIMDTLRKRHISFVDNDGHIAISTSQMVDISALTDLGDIGVQAINARKGENGPYIALYY